MTSTVVCKFATGACALCLAFTLISGCSSRVDIERRSNGLIFRYSEAQDSLTIRIDPDGPEDCVVINPVRLGYFQRGGDKWTFDGTWIDPRVMVKEAALGFDYAIPLRQGIEVKFTVKNPGTAVLVIEPHNSFLPDVEKYYGARIWNAKVEFK